MGLDERDQTNGEKTRSEENHERRDETEITEMRFRERDREAIVLDTWRHIVFIDVVLVFRFLLCRIEPCFYSTM